MKATCDDCQQPRVVTRVPTPDGQSFTNVTKCACRIFVFREDLAVRLLPTDGVDDASMKQ